MNKQQLTDTLLMIRPANFGFNPETAISNAFQKETTNIGSNNSVELAKNEFDGFVRKLRKAGVHVIVVEDSKDPPKPDAVFPNNWISFHGDGSVILYPMLAPSRRIERRPELMTVLSKTFTIKKQIDLSNYENDDIFLEGTGSMVFDRVNKIVYACLSPRTHEALIDKFCAWMGYEKMVFHSVDQEGREIYHTNVMMAMGQDFVVICMDSIRDEAERRRLLTKFKVTGKYVVEINYEQMNRFAGNMLQVKTKEGNSLLIMSEQAFLSLSENQISHLEKLTSILFSPIPTIETLGGGSARCMMAEVFLEKKD